VVLSDYPRTSESRRICSSMKWSIWTWNSISSWTAKGPSTKPLARPWSYRLPTKAATGTPAQLREVRFSALKRTRSPASVRRRT
jgi:hypothetical protein